MPRQRRFDPRPALLFAFPMSCLLFISRWQVGVSMTAGLYDGATFYFLLTIPPSYPFHGELSRSTPCILSVCRCSKVNAGGKMLCVNEECST